MRRVGSEFEVMGRSAVLGTTVPASTTVPWYRYEPGWPGAAARDRCPLNVSALRTKEAHARAADSGKVSGRAAGVSHAFDQRVDQHTLRGS